MRRNREHWRGLVLAVVLLGHLGAIVLVLRADRLRRLAAPATAEARLALIWLRQLVPAPPARPVERARRARATPVAPTSALPEPPLPETPPMPPLPRIDWDLAAERAARAAGEALDREGRYRDLASVWSELSPEQAAWMKRNHMAPTARRFAWQPSRVEVTPEGFPLIHLNEHCVLLPILPLLAFCKVGHIEPNGHLLDHLRDAQEP